MKIIKTRVANAAIAVTIASWAALLIGFLLLVIGMGNWQAITVEAVVCAAASSTALAIRDAAKYRLAYNMGRQDTVEAFARRRVIPLDRR